MKRCNFFIVSDSGSGPRTSTGLRPLVQALCNLCALFCATFFRQIFYKNQCDRVSLCKRAGYIQVFNVRARACARMYACARAHTRIRFYVLLERLHSFLFFYLFSICYSKKRLNKRLHRACTKVAQV